jgi:hypothetical protein
MSARMSLSWITLAVALLVACSGCGKGGASPTGEGAPPVTATPSATAETTSGTAAATGTGQAQSGGGGGSGNSGGGGGGAKGAPLHIPAIILHIGEDLQTEYDKVFHDVVTKCGGTVCVSVGKAGTGKECDYTVTMNGTPVNVAGGADQGNQYITVPRGARIVIDGNALGSSTQPCPSDQPAVAVASSWISQPGNSIGKPGDGGVSDAARAAIISACNDGTACVHLKVVGGPLLCAVDPSPDQGSITVLRGATITLNGNADGLDNNNCPSDSSGTPGSSTPGSGTSGSGTPGSGTSGSGNPGDQSTPSP